MRKPVRPKVSKKSAKRPAQTVAAYLAAVPEPGRTTLHKIREVIRQALPSEATEVLSYGIPAFKYKKVLIWYAAFKDHCSLFPTASVLERFQKDLAKYRVSKGTVHFPLDRPLPDALLKKMVKARLDDVSS